MAKILHLEIENCTDCPFNETRTMYDNWCSNEDTPSIINKKGEKDAQETPLRGILPNCPLEEKKDHA